MKPVMWWVTVGTYWGVAALCLAASRHKAEKIPWRGFAVCFAVLAINKQHDLTGYITRQLRNLARGQNWYGDRHEFQLFIMAAIAGAAVVLLISIIVWARRHLQPSVARWLAASAVYLAAFSMVRAVSLHELDHLLYKYYFGIRLNWVFELGGLLFACLIITRFLFMTRRAQSSR